MKIVYVHHALRDNHGSEFDDLLPLGVEDAKNVAKIFREALKKGGSFKAIYTSPYLRCKKTAKIINKHLNVEIFEDERLNEMDSKVETWIQLQQRVQNALKDIVFKHDENDCVIVVTSGVNVVGFTNLAYGLKPSEKAPILGIPSCSPIIFSISKESF